jgi:fumarylacetoacetate (FAA) hydrolase
MGVSAMDAGKHIKLIMIVNDVSLRNLIPAELAKGFGFFQSKPSSAFSPFVVTPSVLGNAWKDNKLHLPLKVEIARKERDKGVDEKGEFELFGEPGAGIDMTFDFAELIAHAAKTRPLVAGSIIGSGTVSNLDRSKGSCCIAERRMLEILETGAPVTPFLKFGDRVRISMGDFFGTIDQVVEEAA